MRHEKIIKREDGTKIKFYVSYRTDYYSELGVYDINIATCAPKKRKFYSVFSTNDYNYRRLDLAGRIAYSQEMILLVVTKEEILEAKMEPWEMMKPKI